MSSLKAASADSSARERSPGQFPRSTETQPTVEVVVQCFSIRADLDAGLLSRLIEPLAKRGLWPSKFYSQAVSSESLHQPAEAVIDIQIAGLDCATSDHIALQFRGMVGVQSVLTSLRTSSD
jgi:hypothetical protein